MDLFSFRGARIRDSFMGRSMAGVHVHRAFAQNSGPGARPFQDACATMRRRMMRWLRLLRAETLSLLSDIKKRDTFELRGMIGEDVQILHVKSDERSIFEMRSLFFNGIAEVQPIPNERFGVGCDFSVRSRSLFPRGNEYWFQCTMEAFLPNCGL